MPATKLAILTLRDDTEAERLERDRVLERMRNETRKKCRRRLDWALRNAVANVSANKTPIEELPVVTRHAFEDLAERLADLHEAETV